jgi:hypothetical protein
VQRRQVGTNEPEEIDDGVVDRTTFVVEPQEFESLKNDFVLRKIFSI